eukprot:scaffold6978_cov64-Phaeocystis_antarctica.AAC.15
MVSHPRSDPRSHSRSHYRSRPPRCHSCCPNRSRLHRPRPPHSEGAPRIRRGHRFSQTVWGWDSTQDANGHSGRLHLTGARKSRARRRLPRGAGQTCHARLGHPRPRAGWRAAAAAAQCRPPALRRAPARPALPAPPLRRVACARHPARQLASQQRACRHHCRSRHRRAVAAPPPRHQRMPLPPVARSHQRRRRLLQPRGACALGPHRALRRVRARCPRRQAPRRATSARPRTRRPPLPERVQALGPHVQRATSARLLLPHPAATLPLPPAV